MDVIYRALHWGILCAWDFGVKFFYLSRLKGWVMSLVKAWPVSFGLWSCVLLSGCCVFGVSFIIIVYNPCRVCT